MNTTVFCFLGFHGRQDFLLASWWFNPYSPFCYSFKRKWLKRSWKKLSPLFYSCHLMWRAAYCVFCHRQTFSTKAWWNSLILITANVCLRLSTLRLDFEVSWYNFYLFCGWWVMGLQLCFTSSQCWKEWTCFLWADPKWLFLGKYNPATSDDYFYWV